MLIISIIMFVRKKTRLQIAYSVLTIGSLSTIVYDARQRSERPPDGSEAQRVLATKLTAILPITPLALSPFREARPDYPSASESSTASAIRASAEMNERTGRSSSVWFLTVPVKFDSGTKAVALNRGTKVHLVREQDGKFLVRRNGTDFLIEKTQVTDNIAGLGKLVRNSS